MKIDCFSCGNFLHCSYSACQKIRFFCLQRIKYVTPILSNSEAFQKICQITIAVIHSINFYCEKKYLGNFIKILDVANVDDFYEIFQLPYHLSHTIQPEYLNEYSLLHLLDSQIKEEKVRKTARKVLQCFLDDLVAREIAFKDVPSFKKALEDCFQANQELSTIELKNINLVFYKKPILKVLSESFLNIADVICVPHFLQAWQLVNFAQISSMLGNHRLTRWTQRYSLDIAVSAALATGFIFEFCESIRVLISSQSTAHQKKMAWWDFFTAGTEFVFNYALAKSLSERIAIPALLSAKSIGLCRIIFKQSHKFFEKFQPN